MMPRVCSSVKDSTFVPLSRVPFSARSMVPRDANETFRNDQRTRRTIKVRESNNFYHAMKIFNCKIGHPIALLRRHGFDGFDNAAEANFPSI